ncbi:MAG TPA: ABC transporter permease [Nannocystis exedens]|nr:ABC transporter permease [Nannocystis exedens]
MSFFWFVRHALVAQFTRLPPAEPFVRHMVDAGLGSLGLLTLLIFFAGLSLAVQGYASFVRFGGQEFLGLFCGIGGIRELYPVMAAIVCGARIGANLAASLANMQISEQVEALEVMGIEPMRQLVAPRLWAVTLAMPLLCAYAIVVGLGASYLASVHQLGVNPGNFAAQLRGIIGLDDLMTGLFKGVLFGWLVAIVACYHGYSAVQRNGAEGVGIATNRAIVHSAVLCIVLNMVLSAILYA